MPRLPQPFTLFPFTTLFRSRIYTLFLKFRPDKEQRTNRSSIGNRIRQERQHASYAVQRATKRRANQGGNTECHLVLRAGGWQLLLLHHARQARHLSQVKEDKQRPLDQ